MPCKHIAELPKGVNSDFRAHPFFYFGDFLSPYLVVADQATKQLTHRPVQASKNATCSMADNDQPTEGNEGAGGETVSKAEYDKLKKNHEIVRRKLTKAQEKQLSRSDLIKDPEFRKEALGVWEIPHDDEGNYKLPENLKDREAIENEFKARQEKWAAKSLKPLQEQLTAFEEENSALKQDVLYASLERSAKKAGVLDGKFKPAPFGDSHSAPVLAAATRFRFNPDMKKHVLMADAETMELSGAGEPIVADEFFQHFFEDAEDDVKREWLGDQRQRGSGFSANGKARSPHVMTRKEAVESPSKYRAAKAAAKKAGQSLQLID